MSNKSEGTRFEKELAKALSDVGFWVHVLQQNKAGQPADLIVCIGQLTTLIDCKVISGNWGFPLNRVEENQQYAMKRFTERTGTACWFAMQLPDGRVRMISSIYLFRAMSSGAKSIDNGFIAANGLSLDTWVEQAVNRSGIGEKNEDSNQ